jgi:hypothetical protein
MFKKCCLMLLMAFSCLSVLHAQDDDTTWTAYLYDHHGQISQINSEGEYIGNIIVSELFYSTSAPYREYLVTQVAMSPSGRYLAAGFKSWPSSDGMDTPPIDTYFAVYDFTAQTIVVESHLPENAFPSLERGAIFDEAAQQVVMAVEQWSVVESDSGAVFLNADKEVVLHVFDLASGGAPVTTLSAQPFMKEYGIGTKIHEFRDGKVRFSIINSQGDFPMVSSYIWDTATDELVEDPMFTARSEYYAPTGEAIRGTGSSDYPSAEDVGEEFIYFQSNLIEVYDPATESWRPFYHDAAHSLSAQFVQNGERLLVSANNQAESPSFLLLERDGTVVDEFKLGKDFNLANITSTPWGFLYLKEIPTMQQPQTVALIEYDTRNGLGEKRTVDTFNQDYLTNYDVLLFQPSHPVESDYTDWQFLPPFQP